MRHPNPNRLNFEGTLEHHLERTVAAQAALHGALIDYLIDVDATTPDALTFAVSSLGWATFERTMGVLWQEVVEMAVEDAQEQLAGITRGVLEGIAA